MGLGSVRADYDRPFRRIGSDWMSPTVSTIDTLLARSTAEIPAGAVVEAWIKGGDGGGRVHVTWPGSYTCKSAPLRPDYYPAISGPGPYLLDQMTIVCMLTPPSGPGPHLLGLKFENAGVVISNEGSDDLISRVSIRSDDLHRGWGDGLGEHRVPIGVPFQLDLLLPRADVQVRVEVFWSGGAVTCDLVGSQPYVATSVVRCDLAAVSSSATYTLRFRLEPAPSATLTPRR